jgi:hypothetical protein
MYSRILPSSDKPIPREIVTAFQSATGSLSEEDNQVQFKLHRDESYLIPYPIYAEDGDVTIANPAFLNAKYAARNAANLRKLMINRGVGMLKRAMQHLYNATILYMFTALKLYNERMTGVTSAASIQPGANITEQDLQNLFQMAGDDSAELLAVPKGAFPFLTDTDIGAMRYMYKLLCSRSARPDDVVGSARGFSSQGEEWDELMNPNIIYHPRRIQPWKTLGSETVTPLIFKRTAYLEVLLSYWWCNNKMGRMRRRMNFRAKLAQPSETLKHAVDNLQQTGQDMRNLNIDASILKTTWADSALYGLIIAHIICTKSSSRRPATIPPAIPQRVVSSQPLSRSPVPQGVAGAATGVGVPNVYSLVGKTVQTAPRDVPMGGPGQHAFGAAAAQTPSGSAAAAAQSQRPGASLLGQSGIGQPPTQPLSPSGFSFGSVSAGQRPDAPPSAPLFGSGAPRVSFGDVANLGASGLPQ